MRFGSDAQINCCSLPCWPCPWQLLMFARDEHQACRLAESAPGTPFKLRRAWWFWGSQVVIVVVIVTASLTQCVAASHICTCAIMCWRWMWQAEPDCSVALRFCVHAAGPSRSHCCAVLIATGEVYLMCLM